MCLEIIVTMDRGADVPVVTAVALAHGRRLTPWERASAVTGATAGGEKFFCAVPTAPEVLCDCLTPIGSVKRNRLDDGERERVQRRRDRKLRRLRRLGWSEAKIRRAVTDHGSHTTRRARDAASVGTSIDDWIAIASESLTAGSARWIGLLVLMDDESTIAIRDRVRSYPSDDARELLLNAEDNTIYEFVRAD